VRRLALLGACVLGFSPALLAQDATTVEPRPITESADRIAREWWPRDVEGFTFTIDQEGRPRYRSSVTVTQTLPPPWQLSDEPQPANYRGAISHQEMLRVMTPQEFSTPLISGSVDPGSIYQELKKSWREWQARRIHERVVRELAEFEAQRAAADANAD
jgi:hypothetical protein